MDADPRPARQSNDAAANTEIVFYSDFPFAYSTPEAEERMDRFVARGYRVHYVEQLGIRNPRPSHVLRVARPLSRRRRSVVRPVSFDVISPKLIPPRRAPLIAAFNERWLSRQILPRLRDPARAIFWLRFPTPEMLGVLDRADPALVVYELVDEHLLGRGLNRRLRRLFLAAEDRILERAGVVFVSSEAIRERLEPLHRNVIMAPAAAVDIDFLSAAAAAEPEHPPLALYAGSADRRIDADLVAGTAERLPDWRIVLAGPVDRAVAKRLAPVANVELRGPFTQEQLPALLASASACFLPYRTGAFGDTLFPVKLVEALAAGRPVVATPIRTLEELGREVEVAADAEGLAAALRRAAATDSREARGRRVSLARPHSWTNRIDQFERAILEALSDG